jgi:hypothetical protein
MRAAGAPASSQAPSRELRRCVRLQQSTTVRVELAVSRSQIVCSANLRFAVDSWCLHPDLNRDRRFKGPAVCQLTYGGKCSGRESNSDHALIWCLRGISSPLCQLSYRSKFQTNGAPVRTRTVLPRLRGVCFAIKASSAFNEPGRTRTCVDLFRRQMPYPLGYRPNKRSRREA